ncbi:MAG: SIS domain-containing protein [Candidatus Nanopelagicales bacterium]
MTQATVLPLAKPTENVSTKVRAVFEQKTAIDAWVAGVAARPMGITNIYLVGCGGSLFNFSPLQYFLDTQAGVPVFQINAAELTSRQPSQLAAGSLVIASSTRGNTPETAAAATFAAKRGAAVVCVTQDADSIVAQAANEAPNGLLVLHEGAEAKAVAQALLGFAIATATGSTESFEGELMALRQFPEVIASALQESEEIFERLGREQAQNKSGIWVVGAGAQTGAASTLAMCYLQEMQWLTAAAFDAGDYLHGAMEVVTEGTPVVIFVDETSARPLAERVERFVAKWSGNGYVVDTARLSLAGISTQARPFITSWLFHAAFTGRIAQHFEANTGQPLTTRRYMWKVEY